MKKGKILIVEDEPSIRILLTHNIQKAGFDTEIAEDGVEAINKAEKEKFDLIVLDLMLPKMDGMEVCKHLRDQQIDIPILMLTARHEASNKILGLDLGADDYLTKPFDAKELIARINAILRRTNRVQTAHDTPLQIGDLVIYPEQHEVYLKDKLLRFTRKEFELLTYLALRVGKVVSRNQLLTDVWHYDFAGDTRIVDVHISRLRERIETNTKQPTYIKTVRGLGYKMEEPKHEATI